MPSFRGIEVSILTQSDVGRLPEYPHPDASSYQLHDPVFDARDGERHSDEPHSQHAVEDDSPRIPKANPMVSVYVPSVPGAQFWIKYTVEHAPSPPGHLFFKLYMNGRHITSWGINPRIKTQGRVEKALYEPSDRWNQEENGVVFKQQGIEARYFYFMGDQQELSVADDGGLIEVQVFRAKGRKRRAAKLDQYRVQDRYGITTPSGGLLDNPQDVTFFDFHLVDPKDAPFASFRFHYRSLTNLYQLNLIPSDDPSILESSVTSIARDLPEPGPARDLSILEQNPDFDVRTASIRRDPDESVFDDSAFGATGVGSARESAKPRRNSSYMLRTPPQLRPRSATSHKLPQPSKSLRDALPPGFPESYLQRPLPDRPLPELPSTSPNIAWAPRSRKSSSASAAPSVAPSLLSYVKNGSFLDETVEYGNAQEMPMDKAHPGVPLNQDKVVSTAVPTLVTADTSFSDCEGSSLANAESKEDNSMLLSPGNYMASSGSTREMHMALLQDDQDSHRGRTTSLGSDDSPRTQGTANTSGDLDINFSKFPHLQLSESEWVRRTPSPEAAPRRILSPRFGRLWNTLRRSKSRSPLRSLRNHRDEAASRNYSTPQLASPEMKERHGHWI